MCTLLVVHTRQVRVCACVCLCACLRVRVCSARASVGSFQLWKIILSALAIKKTQIPILFRSLLVVLHSCLLCMQNPAPCSPRPKAVFTFYNLHRYDASLSTLSIESIQCSFSSFFKVRVGLDKCIKGCNLQPFFYLEVALQIDKIT